MRHYRGDDLSPEYMRDLAARTKAGQGERLAAAQRAQSTTAPRPVAQPQPWTETPEERVRREQRQAETNYVIAASALCVEYGQDPGLVRGYLASGMTLAQVQEDLAQQRIAQSWADAFDRAAAQGPSH
jgi:hypothetical protein